MEITIRRILIAEAPVLSKMAKQTFYDTFTGTCTEEDMQAFLEQYYNLEQIKKELSNPDDYCFFAEINGEPVGYIRFMEDSSNFAEVNKWKSLELKRLYVLKEYHGKGIAQKLMEFFIAFAEQYQYELVWLGVWEYNFRAQKFYSKYGFINSGHTHDFPIGDTPQTDIYLWRFLK
jgi:ribosomal protein S18 acetylase RimI-like enzyme